MHIKGNSQENFKKTFFKSQAYLKQILGMHQKHSGPNLSLYQASNVRLINFFRRILGICQTQFKNILGMCQAYLRPGISETNFCISRPSPRLEFSESQFRDRVQDSNFLSLNFETESETQFFQVSISKLSRRLTFSKSQYRDRVQDWNFKGLSFETESETEFFRVSILRPSIQITSV